jgi:hypothetical protein
VGPDTGSLRGDYCGVLILCTRNVTEITDEFIRIGNGRAFRLEPVKMPGMIPIWETKR